ncbi:MAG: hypothetical protein JNM63_14145 [Spirochaetia bacterium]|nr:hypothetical protein [Spirochaetia bacterium]
MELTETIIRLIQLFRDDAEMRTWIERFAPMSQMEQNIVLTAFLQKMKNDPKRKGVAEAFEVLRDPDVVAKIKAQLKASK